MNNITDNANGNNRGDICRFIGAVTPALEGYRMPTSDELNQGGWEAYGSFISFNPTEIGGKNWVESGRLHGTARVGFPASGGRNYGMLIYVGTGATYWSGSATSSNTTAYILDFWGSGVYPDMGGNRGSGFPVRCVKD
jgi:hypothetical protein